MFLLTVPVSLFVEFAVLGFALTGAAALGFLVAYAASRGRPKNFTREMYWTLFMTIGAAAGGAVFYALQMHADVRTPAYLFQVGLFLVGILLSGVAAGSVVAIFTHRSGAVNSKQ